MVPDTQAMVLTESDAGSVGMDARQLDHAAEYVAVSVQDGDIPLAALLVARRGRIVLHRSFVHPQVAEQGIRVEPDSIFRVASITKVLTATLVMRSVELGHLSLEAPVAEVIPEFRKNGKEAVTPRHLLSHSSGLSDQIEGPRPTSFQELLQRVYEQPPAFAPGTRSSYCTVAFDVLVELLQRTTGRSLEELGAELLFGPLKMANSHFNVSGQWRQRVIPLFDRNLVVDNAPFDSGLERIYHLKFAMGGANGLSNITDLAVLGQMMLNGGAYGPARVLSPVTVDRMVERQFPWWDSPERLSSPQKYNFVSKGLGWMVRGGSHYRGSDIMSPTAFFHGGAYGTRLLVDPAYDMFLIFVTSAYHDAPLDGAPGAGRRRTLHHHQIHQVFGTMALAAVTDHVRSDRA